MAKQVQLRRGNTAVNGSFVGAQGELVVDTQANILVLHDGFTSGGHKVASKAYVDALIATDSGNVTFTGNTISTLGTNENLFIVPNGSGTVTISSLTVTNTITGNITGLSDNALVYDYLGTVSDQAIYTGNMQLTGSVAVTVALPTAYTNANYKVQLTYDGMGFNALVAGYISANVTTSSQFTIVSSSVTDINSVFWTTFGSANA